MFTRLFGATEAEQMAYLNKRSIITLICFGLDVIIGLIGGGGGGLTVIMAYVWGWRAIKAMFGFAAGGMLLTRNVFFAVAIFLVYVFVGAIVGGACMILGVGRFLYLKVKQKKQGGL